jgi:hypothetical protein
MCRTAKNIVSALIEGALTTPREKRPLHRFLVSKAKYASYKEVTI